MSSSADQTGAATPSAVVAALRSASLLAVRVRPTGDTLAAAGLLARAAQRLDTPFHLRATRQPELAVEGTTVFVGYPDHVTVAAPDEADTEAGRSIRLSADRTSVTGHIAELLREAGIEPAPVLTLAGQVAAGEQPSGEPLEAAERADAVTRRPGVGVPTAELATGLAYTTALRLPVSNDPAAATELLAAAGLDERREPESLRRLASLVALDATSDRPAAAVAATQRRLHPHETDGPFGSVEGYADLLSALAVADPGLGVAAATQPASVADAALNAWREHGQRVHAAFGDARTARYDGVFVCRVEDEPDDSSAAGHLPGVARLAGAFRSPEPRTLVVGDGRAAAVGTPAAPVAEPLRAAAEAADGTWFGDRRGTAQFAGDTQPFVERFREAVRS